MIRTDVIVIGAGLLGCFAARNLTRYDISVTVLEKEEDVCCGISKANTGIIYAGYDHKAGTVKSSLCVRANEAFSDLCEDLDVRYAETGSLMVAYGPSADRTIRRKYEDGLKSGVRGLRLLNGAEAEKAEPTLRKGITSALYSETTGTVDPWELCIAAYENAEANGAEFRFGEKVRNIYRRSGRLIVETEDEIYDAGAVVNAAGLSSDAVREMTEEPLIRLFPTAADYIVLDREPRGAVKHIVFIEEEDGKGLTLVPTADGNILAGPTDRDATEEEVRSRDMRVSREGLEEIRRKCIEAVPELDIDSQIRTFGSLRPNPFSVREEQGRIIRSSKSIKDIQLFSEDGLFSLIGIKTPGLTIADELGRLTAERVTEYLGCSTLRENFDPRRKGITRISDLTYSERAELAATDSACSEIVCSCMDVTRREILEAYERGARSVEAIKRRTGAGMGRCQGSRCRKKILDILASCDSQKVIQ